MNLRGKKILLMGGGAFSKDIKEYADEEGFYIIAVGSSPDTPLKTISDEFYQIDTQDINKIIPLVKEKKINGIFVGASEVNIAPAIKVAERCKINFYVNQHQWDLISNKAYFKKIARRYGIPVTEEYKLSKEMLKEDLEKIKYPVIVKPVDGSGARGINACYNEDDLRKYYMEALQWSRKKEVLVEELITNGIEVFFHYTIQEGNFSLSMGFTKFKVQSSEKEYISLPIFHMYPSIYLKQYIEKIDIAAKKNVSVSRTKKWNRYVARIYY